MKISARAPKEPIGGSFFLAANPHVPLATTLPGGLTLSVPVIEQQDLSEELPPWLR